MMMTERGEGESGLGFGWSAIVVDFFGSLRESSRRFTLKSRGSFKGENHSSLLCQDLYCAWLDLTWRRREAETYQGGALLRSLSLWFMVARKWLR